MTAFVIAVTGIWTGKGDITDIGNIGGVDVTFQ
jgi:hypothetical protein